MKHCFFSYNICEDPLGSMWQTFSPHSEHRALCGDFLCPPNDCRLFQADYPALILNIKRILLIHCIYSLLHYLKHNPYQMYSQWASKNKHLCEAGLETKIWQSLEQSDAINHANNREIFHLASVQASASNAEQWSQQGCGKTAVLLMTTWVSLQKGDNLC